MKAPRISASPLFFLPFLMLFLFNSAGWLLLLLLAALIHEAGHLIAIALTGNAAEKIRLCPMGAAITLRDSLCGYKKEAIIHLAGPLANAAAACAALLAIRATPSERAFFFFFCNLLLCFFNLLPVNGLDGGKALFCFLALVTEEDKALYFLRITGTISVFAMLICGIFVLIKTGGNFSLILMTFILFADLFAQKRKP